MQSVSQGFSEVAGPLAPLEDAIVRGGLVHVLIRAVKQAAEQIAREIETCTCKFSSYAALSEACDLRLCAQTHSRVLTTTGCDRWLVGPMERQVADIDGVQQKSAVHIVRCRYGMPEMSYYFL